MKSPYRQFRTRPVAGILVVLALLVGAIAITVSAVRRRQQALGPMSTLNALTQLGGSGPMQQPPPVDPKVLEMMRQYQLGLRAAMAPGAPSNGTASNNERISTPIPPLPVVVIKGEAMAQAFRSGHLPAPLAQPQGTPEQTAAELAKRVIAEDDQSTAALLTALQMSGFSVRADDGSLAYASVKPGQGIAIDAWEVAAQAKLFGEDMRLNLTDLSRVLARILPPLKNAPVATLLLQDLRAAAQAKQPSVRFWADFIAELGRQSTKPYDLLSPNVDGGIVELDAIQVSLILRRVLADLIILNGNENHKAQANDRDSTSPRWAPASYEFGDQTRPWPYVHDAVWRSDEGLRFEHVAEGGGSSAPCTLTELQSQVMDVSAYGLGRLWTALFNYAEYHGMEGAEGVGKKFDRANALLALIKLYVYYACMETDIQISGGPPLKRTTSIYHPGERRTLTATVRENMGKNWQMLNCFRTALNIAANLDISLPNDGAVEGVKTQWILMKGGVGATGREVIYPFVEFVSPPGTPRIQDATVPISDPSAPKTNDKGQTTIDIEGVKQRAQLFDPIPVMKQAEVRFTAAAKAVTMSQDLIDALGVTGVSVDPSTSSEEMAPGPPELAIGTIGFAVGAAVEMLLRSNIELSKALYIPVQDWQSCDGGWGGTVSYQITHHTVRNHSDNTSTDVDVTDETVDYAINLRASSNGGAGWSGSARGSFSASYRARGQEVIVYAPVKDFAGASYLIESTETAVGSGDNASVEIHTIGENRYEIQVTGGEDSTIHGEHRSHRTCTGECPRKQDPDENHAIDYSVPGLAVAAQADPYHPEVLSDGTTLQDTPSAGFTTKIIWDLRQCQGSH